MAQWMTSIIGALDWWDHQASWVVWELSSGRTNCTRVDNMEIWLFIWRLFRGPVDQCILNRSGKSMLSRGESGWLCWLSVYRDLDRKHAVQQSLYTALEEVGAFNLPPDSKPHFLCDTLWDLQPYNSVLFLATCGWTARPKPVKKWPTLTVRFGIAACQHYYPM